MSSEECVGIGVEIEANNINICCFNGNGDFIKDIQLLAPKPLVPGAVTVRLCEFLVVEQKFKHLRYLGLAFPGIIDKECRCIKQCHVFDGWTNVPIAEWLEVRLGIKVFISSTTDCKMFSASFKPISTIPTMPLLVGFMAQKNF